jgi:hypothetical protein
MVSILNLFYRAFLRSALAGMPDRSTPMTEIVAALLVGFSISIFLLHAVDAYRAG